MKRWLSLLEVADGLAKHNPRVATLNRKRRREHALRKVRRVEELYGVTLTKRSGREWFVSIEGMDALQKWEPDSLQQLGRSVSDLHANQKADRKRMNSHGAKLREHELRLGIVEEKQRLADQYLSGLAQIDRRTSAA